MLKKIMALQTPWFLVVVYIITNCSLILLSYERIKWLNLVGFGSLIMLITLLFSRCWYCRTIKTGVDTKKTRIMRSKKAKTVLILLLSLVALIGYFKMNLMILPLCAAIVVWEVVIRERSFASLGITKSNFKKAVILGLLVGVVAMPGAFYLFRIRLAVLPGDLLRPGTVPFFLVHYPAPLAFILYVAYIFIVIATTEELFFRGFIQKRLEIILGTPTGILGSALLYAGVHTPLFRVWPVNITFVFVFITFLVGLLLGIVYRETTNIISAWLGHGIMVSLLALVVGMF